MNYKKVVFMRCAPLSKLIYESAYIKELIYRGFEVDYIDTTYLHTDNLIYQEFNGFKNIIKVKSIDDFKKYLKKQNNNNTLFIELVQFDYKSIRLYLLLKRYHFKVGFFARYAVKSVKVKTRLKQKLNNIFIKIKNRVGLKLGYYLKRLNLLKSYDYIFTGGNMALDFFFKGDFYKIDREKAKIINVNATDYDLYRWSNIIDEKPKEQYIVFLDQYIPYHPDFVISKKKTLTPEAYYKGLNKKFKEIEYLYQLKVVIAAHPKALNYKTANLFQGREIIFGNTLKVVANSNLVLVHYSTSINFAVLYKKPIIFLMNKELEEVLPVPAKRIYELSETLECPISHFEETFIRVKVEVNKSKYQQYKYDYMTSIESENQSTLDIFTAFLNQSN